MKAGVPVVLRAEQKLLGAVMSDPAGQAGGSSSNGLGKVARDVDCSGPCTAWQNDMIAELQYKRMSGAVAEYGQALRDISDRQWLGDQGIDREAGE